MRVGLAQEILDFVNFIRGVDSHEHGADFGRGPEGDVPGGHVGGPDGHVAALLDTHADERARKLIDIVAELRIRARIVAGRIAESVLIGELLHHAVKHLGEGQIDERFLLPDIFAGFGVVVVEVLTGVSLTDIPVHEIGEMGENDGRVAQVRRPALDPFEGDVPLVIDGAQGEHHIVDGQIALAHKAVFDLAVFHDGILRVDIFNVCAEVLHRGFRRFAGDAVRVMDVPQGGDVVAGDLVQDFGKALGITVNAVCLHRQGDAGRFRHGGEAAQGLYDHCVVDLAVRGGELVGEHADKRRFELAGEVDVLRELFKRLVGALGIFQCAARRQAWDLKTEGGELL